MLDKVIIQGKKDLQSIMESDEGGSDKWDDFLKIYWKAQCIGALSYEGYSVYWADYLDEIYSRL